MSRFTTRRPLRLLAALPLTILPLAILALAGCRASIQAPTDAGVCYHLAAIQNGKPKFNVVARNIPDLEHCAGELEAMRVRFLSLGSTNTDIVGAYQGNFLFLDDQGVFTADSYTSPRYPFLVRSGNHLVPVGSQ